MAKFMFLFRDGGPVFTYSLLVMLLFVLILVLYGALFRLNSKIIPLIKHISWFIIAWGFLGRTIGLITAFDSVNSAGEFTPNLLAKGLKMALVNPLFALTFFIIARIGIIILVLLSKEEESFNK